MYRYLINATKYININMNMYKIWQEIFFETLLVKENTVELHLSRLIGTTSHLDMQKIRIIGIFFENRLNWQFEVRLLLFTVCTCV